MERIDLPRLKSEDIVPILELVGALEKTKNKRVIASITGLIEAYCRSLSAAGVSLYQANIEGTYKPGMIMPRETKETTWFR